MPEEKNEPMIDVGEDQGAEIDLDQNNEQAKEQENEKLEVVEDNNQSDNSSEKSDEQSNVQASSEEKKDVKQDELAKYSEGVQKRISKLTRKIREAERQREEAIAFAQAEKQRREEYEGRLTKLDKSYVSEFENRVKNSLTAARQALKTAIENQDVDGQITAQQQIATLTMDEAKLQNLKAREAETPKQEKEVNITSQQTVKTYQGKELPDDVPTDAKAEAWASKNSWFGSDSAMTY